MSVLVAGLGMALVIEGLVFALAPRRLEDVVALVARMPQETRRLLGLVTIGIGVMLLWIAGV